LSGWCRATGSKWNWCLGIRRGEEFSGSWQHESSSVRQENLR